MCFSRTVRQFLAATCFAAAAGAAAAEKLSYNEHIQPILAEYCFHCHGPDAGTRKGKLRLDRAADALSTRGDRGAAVVPGNLETSLLIERILSPHADEVMPPPEAHKTLKPEDIAKLKRWVQEGAEYEEHWAFVAPRRPAVPAGDAAVRRWAKNPIDAFVAEQWAARQMGPSPEEERGRLFRRVTLDLTGLPPTPEELAEYLGDGRPDAYERAVDRLLATPAAAENAARHWLDAVRYADTHGIHIDNYRSIWPYRDWVIEAFRQNMPFDRFTIEQVAGDLLPDATLEQKVASGFNRCLPTTSEGGAIAEEYEAIYAKDRVDTVGAVWLGLTLGCASCHDHKFDPVSAKDFYALAAFFRNSTMPAMDGNRHDTPPVAFVPAAADRVRWPELQAAVAAATADVQARKQAGEADFAAWLAGAPAALVPLPADRHTTLHVPLNEPGADRADGLFGPAPRLADVAAPLGPPSAWRPEMAESVSLFVKTDGTPDGTLVSSLDAEGKGPGWEMFLEKGKIGLLVRDGTGTVEVRNVGSALAPGKWHHLLLCYDTASLRSRTIEVFVNGGRGVNSTISAHLPVDIVPTAPLRLGSRHAADGGAAATVTGATVWVQDLRRMSVGFMAPDTKAFSDLPATLAALQAPAEGRTEAQRRMLRAYYFAAVDPAARALAAKRETLLAEEDAVRARGAVTLVMEEKKNSEPFAHILNRGEYSQPGERVGAGVPEALPPLPGGAPRNRLGLAQWLVAPENPLTARVTMNRLWQQFFGTGLVESTGDFGIMGDRPSHPRLLDWLAVEFRDSGWDLRRMTRAIVTSATYRQSAKIAPAALERDPGNRWLARGPRHRLDAEVLRDQALAAAGLLVAKIGGRPVRPYQPEGIWEAVAMKESTTRYYRPGAGEDLYRRSLYTLWKRTAAPAALEILNAPSREVTCVRRDRTNTPLQALVTLNDPTFVEASRQLATRALRAEKTTDGRFDHITRRLLGRPLARDERAVVARTLDDARQRYAAEPELARRLTAVGASPADPGLPAPELAAWTLVASQIMNLDEALTK